MPSYKPLILGALVLSISASLPMTASCLSAPDVITLNQNGKLYKPFSFDHAKHIQIIKECSDCHHHTTGTLVTDPNCAKCHSNSSPTKVVSCKGCHSAKPFSPESLAAKSENKQRFHLDVMGIKGAMHENCLGCHEKKGAGPTGCQDCHPRTASGNAFYDADKKGKAGHAKAE
ncbi:MAG TPA: cytochrome c3 family protein [Geomonas sp.]|nr:cytochrome c3 family protein [Geomonas sp.]